MLIHGGAWLIGDKRAEQLLVVPHLLERGYAVASIGYRLSTEATFPAAVQDGKAALRRLKQDAATLGVDGDRVAAWGASAGAHTAALLGVTGDQATLFDTTSDPDVDASLAAVVDWYGPVRLDALDTHHRESPPGRGPGHPLPWPPEHDHPDSPESRYLGAPVQTVPDRVRAADPTTYVAAAAVLPAFLVVHGRDDHHVPYLQSVLLADALRAAGGDVDLHVLPGRGHGGAEWLEDVLPLTLDWLDAVLRDA